MTFWRGTGGLAVAKSLGQRSTTLLRVLWSVFLSSVLFPCFLLIVCAQTQPSSPQAPPPAALQSEQKPDAKASNDEITSHDTPATFKVSVIIVLVRVVVRDAQGKAVTNLKKEDFQLADDRKPQTISSFSVENRGSHGTEVVIPQRESQAATTGTKTVKLPERFVSFFFDDLHLVTQDVMVTRQAATKLFAVLQPTDRISIFTTSGQVEQDFTADRQKLEEKLQHVGPRGMSTHSATDCPSVSFYEAHKIVEARDPVALQVAILNAIACGVPVRAAPEAAQAAAQRELSVGETELQLSFSNLASLIRRIGALPGERSIVLMSPGFFMTPSMRQSSDMIERATRVGIVINTIDARGLYVPAADADLMATQRCQAPECQSFIRMEELLRDDVLAELADGTGGLFIHNRNDIDKGLLEAAAEPEAAYVLGFSPLNLKLDGKYHHLTIALARKEKFTLQARHGYFAPTKAVEPAIAASEEIQGAIYSHEEFHDLPIDCETKFFKNGESVRLSVSAIVDLRGLKFRKAQDRNVDNVTVATAVFDDNGNLLTGLQRVINLKLKDATLERLKQTGISVKSDFTVKLGTYLVRLVVRDSEGAQMAAMNRGVAIP